MKRALVYAGEKIVFNAFRSFFFNFVCILYTSVDWIKLFINIDVGKRFGVSGGNIGTGLCASPSRCSLDCIVDPDFYFSLIAVSIRDYRVTRVVSNFISFANPKAPVYPRLAQGKSWNEMTVTWTSGYNIDEDVPLVECGFKGRAQSQTPAGTLIFNRNSMCGPPARTFGWRDPGFIHTSFLKELWPNTDYTYKLGHDLLNGTIIWSKSYYFKSSPYPGQDSLQRVVIF
ncbi:hypothetical protein UlMin_007699, partial [Ulmus minor]